MSVRIGVHGANGRMGLAVIDAISQNSRFALVAKFSKSNEAQKITDLIFSDVIIDFSAADAISPLLAIAIKHRIKLVIGTTGLKNQHFDNIAEAAKIIPILYAANTSVGANLLIEISGKIAATLNDYDAEIIDLHHKLKKDAPSGTAIAIGNNIASARNQNFNKVAVFDRCNKSLRSKNDIGFSTIRAGSIWGEHEVIFANSSEVVTLGARALSRSVFAEGALFAANWLNKKAPGLYSMKDALNL